ncbi:MAG: molybdopterin molybdotransferase MoeA [Candidatus Nitrosocosmicus sp.]
MSKIESYTSVHSALTRIFQLIIINPKSEFVPVFSSAGRVLSDDIKSNHNIPEYNSSHMDGYAVNSKDTINASASNPVTLKVAKEISVLGELSTIDLKSREAFRIHTGGFLPHKADAVIPIENTSQNNDDKIVITRPASRGNFVYESGSDIKRGSEVLSKGQILRVQDMTLLANLKLMSVPVFQKPKVAIIPTGSELTDNLTEYKNNSFKKIINTNGPLISFITGEIGAIPYSFPVIEDNLDLLKTKLKLAFEESDIVVTIGGSSIGKHDLVAESVNSIRKPGLIIHGVRLDRGRVSGLGVINEKPVVMLPGPIQGALNAFIAFARPMIRSFQGLPQKSNLSVIATISDDWTGRKRFINFKKIVYVKVCTHKNNLIAIPYVGETQSISLLTKCNGYIEVPEETTEIKTGEKVLVNLLPGFSFIKDRLF